MKRLFYYLFLFITFLVIFCAWKVFGPATSTAEGKYLYIATGSSFRSVSDKLVAQKVITGSFWFNQISHLVNYDRAVKAGRYKLEEGSSIFSLIRLLKSGKQYPVNLVITKIRIKEDLAKKIGDNFEVDSSSMMLFFNNKDTLSKYHLDSNTLLTAVLPNTYAIQWNTTPSRIFKRLLSEELRFWNSKRKADASRLNLSLEQVYILSSIVEEETNADADKGKIASVYLNRMNNGMKLAADPTVKYALRNFALKRILNVHTHVNSPYNTYSVKGLPPGPICTPSMRTIDAVLHAPSTNYIFFVARPDRSGRSDFAQSYAEHKKNAVIYQHWLDSLFAAKKLSRDGSKPTN